MWANKISLPLSLKNAIGLILVGLGCGAVIKVATQPLVSQPQPSLLPETIHVDGWQMTQSWPEKSVANDVSYDQLLLGKAYEYTRPGKQFTLQLGYFFNTNGEVLALRDRLASFHMSADATDLEWTEQVQATTGRYLIAQSATEQTLLLTCINPQGQNTINRAQFSDNRLRYDISLQQVFQWLLGRSQFFDKRCLWTQLSLEGVASEAQAHQIAETLLRDLQPHLSQIL